MTGSWSGGSETSPQCQACAAGRYGSGASTDSSCAGPCQAGYWCPERSSSDMANECGDSSLYCPEGSARVTPVSSGFYSIGGSGNTTRTGQQQCEANFFCVLGIRTECPAGTFAPERGSISCSTPANGYYLVGTDTLLPCPEGFFCQAGLRYQCGNVGVYCPGGNSSVAALVARPGFFTTGGNESTRTGEEPCPAGNACVSGQKIECSNGSWSGPEATTCEKCADGRYGSGSDVDANCQGPCPAGKYCVDGSILDCPSGTFHPPHPLLCPDRCIQK